MKNSILILCLCSISFSLDCLEGEVDLGWGDCNDWNSNHSNGCMSSGCYSIEETTSIYFYESIGNLLQGEISPNIGELVNLTLVRLDDINQLTGVIPSEIGNLTNLQYLTLENNQLTGVIPSEIGNLTNLEYLKLTNNQVSGDIPSEIWNLTNLRYLYLGGNQLTGEIPSEIGNLTSLVDLKLGNNQLTGEIPIELWSMNQNSLDFFDLSNNQLSGEIPDEIENSSFIFSFYLNDNQLSGIIPENTCQIIFLQAYSDQFKFGNNNFCPPYPDCLVNQEPFVDENGNGIWDEGESYEDTNLNGVYEENYVGEQDILNCEEPPLCNEEIEVELWGECYNIEMTTFINFSYQEGSDYLPLSGGIPPEIGQLVNLTDLYLGGNELTVIPDEIGNLVNLQSLFLYDNQFTTIPSEIGNLTNLRTLDIGYNQITELPNELFSLSHLELLRLEYNELTSISNDLCNLSGCTIYINNNYICPLYPDCLTEEDIGYQDTSECIECPELQGDINFDDNINVLDVVTMITCIFSDDGCDICSDINDDSIVNVLDVVILVNIILGN